MNKLARLLVDKVPNWYTGLDLVTQDTYDVLLINADGSIIVNPLYTDGSYHCDGSMHAIEKYGIGLLFPVGSFDYVSKTD